MLCSNYWTRTIFSTMHEKESPNCVVFCERFKMRAEMASWRNNEDQIWHGSVTLFWCIIHLILEFGSLGTRSSALGQFL